MIERVESKIFVTENNSKTAVAEVIEGCGCGFTHLIRIHPDYKQDEEVFRKCLKLCNTVNDAYMMKDYMNGSYEREYLINNPDVAVMIDKII